MKHLSRWLFCLAGLCLAGCDYTVPLVQTPAHDLDGDTLRVRLLNPETVDRAAASPAALQQAILAARTHPKLYRPTKTFRRIEE